MSRNKKMIAKIKELMYEPQKIRNIGICAHIDHGKTTLSDNLMAGAGLISKDLAGDQLVMDTKEDEKKTWNHNRCCKCFHGSKIPRR